MPFCRLAVGTIGILLMMSCKPARNMYKFNYWNKLKVNSASGLFLFYGYITTHRKQNTKFPHCLHPIRKCVSLLMPTVNQPTVSTIYETSRWHTENRLRRSRNPDRLVSALQQKSRYAWFQAWAAKMIWKALFLVIAKQYPRRAQLLEEQLITQTTMIRREVSKKSDSWIDGSNLLGAESNQNRLINTKFRAKIKFTLK